MRPKDLRVTLGSWAATVWTVTTVNELLKVIPSPGRELPNPMIHRLLIGKAEIWLATLEGLGRLDLNSYKLSLFQNDPNSAQSISDNRIRRVSQGRDNKIWVSTQKGLDLFDRQTQSFTRYALPKLDTMDRLGRGFRRVAEDSKGNVWASTYWQGLQILIKGTAPLPATGTLTYRPACSANRTTTTE